MVLKEKKQPQCSKCGAPITQSTCQNCGFDTMRESLLSIENASQNKDYYQNEFSFFKEQRDKDHYQTGHEYKREKIFFGSYYQNNQNRFFLSKQKEPIEWLILEKKGNQALLLSKYALNYKPYNSRAMITWEECSLRSWLNKKFLNQAFTSEEQFMIMDTTVNADTNPKFNTDPGNATVDRVFLLSISEVNRYFSSNSSRQCQGTEYCTMRKRGFEGLFSCPDMWWLRSPGDDSFRAAYVSSDGFVNYFGDHVASDNHAVRPAMWVNLES